MFKRKNEFEPFASTVWQTKYNWDNTKKLSIWKPMHIQPTDRMNSFITTVDQYQPAIYSQTIGGISEEETEINGVNRKNTNVKQTGRLYLRVTYGEGHVC